MYDIEKIEVTESTIITSHETSYFTKPGVDNVFNAAKVYYIKSQAKKPTIVNRSSFDKIFSMINLHAFARNQYIEILLITYSSGSEEEDFLTTSIQNKITLLGKRERLNSYVGVFTHQETSDKLPKIHIDYLNYSLESIDLLIMLKCKCLPQNLIELYEVSLINGSNALMKKSEFIKLIAYNWNSNESISTLDWLENIIEIKNDEEIDINDKSRYWIVVSDIEGKEAIVNVNQFKLLYKENKKEFVIEDYDGNKRKISKSSSFNINKPVLKAVNKSRVLNIKIIDDTQTNEIQPELNPENKCENKKSDFPLISVDTNQEKEMIEKNELSQPMKPKLKSNKRNIEQVPINTDIKDKNNVISKRINEVNANRSKSSIPLNIINDYINKMIKGEQLPSKEEIIDTNGKSIRIKPNDVTKEYLCQIYIEDIDPVTSKYYQVADPKSNKRILVCQEESDRLKACQSDKALVLKDITGNNISIEDKHKDIHNDNDKQWIIGYDVDHCSMYIQNSIFMKHLSNPKEIKSQTEFIDNNDKKRQMNIMSYLANAYSEYNPELYQTFKLKPKDQERIYLDEKPEALNEQNKALRSKRKPLNVNSKGSNDNEVNTNDKADHLNSVYTDIKDSNKTLRIIKADESLLTSSSNKDKVLLDANGDSFTPHSNDIEYFNKDNEMHQLYKLLNDKNEEAYILKPYIISCIDRVMKSKGKPPAFIQVYDFKLDTHNIPLKTILSFIPLTKYYNQIIKTRKISKKTNCPKVIQHQLIEEEETNDDQMTNLNDYLIPQSFGDDDIGKYKSINEESNDNNQSLNQYRHRYNTTRDNKQFPYSFKDNDTNSYYEIPNFLIKKKEIKSRQEIVSQLEKTNQASIISDYILVSILSDNNSNNEYIEIEDSEQNKYLTKKVYLMKYIKKLINNEPLARYCFIEDSNYVLIKIEIQITLIKHFFYTPSPYIKDGVLIDINNTLYESTSDAWTDQPEGYRPQFIYCNKDTYKLPTIDLFEYMEIEDINENKFIARKPFVRSLLYTPNRIINVPIRDSANQLRLVSPISVLGPKFSNLARYNKQKPNVPLINDINIYVNVKDTANASRLITKKAFDDFSQLYSKGKIKPDEVFTVIDRKNNRFLSTIALMIQNNKKIRQWVLINDINNSKCLIYKNLLLKILSREYYEKDNFVIIDMHNKERLVNPWLIKLKLKNEYEVKALSNPAMLPLESLIK